MSNPNFDVIIVGGGPAGLTAAIYTARENLRTLILEKLLCGGWPNMTGVIENYPGFPEGINGMELSTRFKEQAQKFGVGIREFEEVKRIESSGAEISVETDKEVLRTRSLIVTPGSRVRELGVFGERELLGKGVSYCATCDGPLYRDREVAVIGGGNAALEEALFLTKFASRVHLIHRRDKFRGEKYVVGELEKNNKVSFVLNSLPVSINGKDAVESITVMNKLTEKEETIAVEGVFVFVGVEPNTEFLQGVLELDEGGFIKADMAMRTSVPGIFTAGDVRSGNVRQIAAACGEGTVAALSVRDLLVDY
ncbi:MAG: thioredoxin-disulfide reductase [Candidatus Auribacterota bacterium]|nr:thioredoxin-disulfide reductase [Candidatus Auribacterota bacterium]